ncbi:hypothetical protein [Pseudomonas fluorescens]|uniref:hypothetical protein n=1 Tax=Pseudomonas fluorescens TaxID=294 RepID=UPI001A9ED8FF|nr:hypothetical protein [Pseudomonas fluorescens]QTD30718.1 hypothetical protein JZM58_15515 [Pseudomonas fluorescens]
MKHSDDRTVAINLPKAWGRTLYGPKPFDQANNGVFIDNMNPGAAATADGQ